MSTNYDLEIQEMLEELERPKTYLPATVIHFLAIIAVEFKIGEKYYDDYMDDPYGEKSYIYLLNISYLGIVDKLIEFPNINKSYLIKLENINKLIFALGKLNKKCRFNLKDFESRAQAKKCLNLMYRESITLLLTEINNCGFMNKLKSLKDDTLTQYIKFILDFEETKLDKEFLPTFKEILEEIL